eukprot:6746361-Pyramimonas_sp.AAC.1
MDERVFLRTPGARSSSSSRRSSPSLHWARVAVKKPTFLHMINITLQRVLPKCQGDSKYSENSALQGSFPGTSINKTAAAAVYPLAMVTAIVHDVHDYLNTGVIKDGDESSLFYAHLWSCERCRRGLHKKLADGTNTPTSPRARMAGCRFSLGRA